MRVDFDGLRPKRVMNYQSGVHGSGVRVVKALLEVVVRFGVMKPVGQFNDLGIKRTRMRRGIETTIFAGVKERACSRTIDPQYPAIDFSNKIGLITPL